MDATNGGAGRGRPELIRPAWHEGDGLQGGATWSATGADDSAWADDGNPWADEAPTSSDVLEAGGVASCVASWRDTPTVAAAVAGFEAEVKTLFSAPGPGCWLPAREGEVVLVMHTQENLLFVRAHTRPEQQEGWIPLECMQSISPAYYMFTATLRRSQESPALGLAWTAISDPVCGLRICSVLPHSMVSRWNADVLLVFGRDQLLVGDVIIRVNDVSDAQQMRNQLHEKAVGERGNLRLTVVRLGALLVAKARGVADSDDLLACLAPASPAAAAAAENNWEEC